MTEFELLQLIDSYRALIIEIFALFVTMFSAYLIASYYIVRKLSRPQFLILNLGYSLVAFGTISSELGAYGLLIDAMNQLASMETTLPVQTLGNNSWAYAVICMTLMFLSSFIFSYGCRKGDIENS